MTKTSLVIGATAIALTSLFAGKPDAAQRECMKQAALDGRKAMQACKSKKGVQREDCENKTRASLVGAERACAPAR